jgi:hypothetical protein
VELRQDQQISLGRAQLGWEIPGRLAIEIPVLFQKLLDPGHILFTLD